MTAEYSLYSPLAGPSAATDPDTTTWSDSLPFLVDNSIAPESSLPLFDENTQWVLNPMSPSLSTSWAAGAATRTASDPSSNASFINPAQSLHEPSWNHNPYRKLSTDPIYPFAPIAIQPTLSLQDITSRGSSSSSSSSSSRQPQFSVGSSSSTEGQTQYHSQSLSTSRSRARSGSSQTEANTSSSGGFEDHERERRKRERFLERNRVAANKCRKKKKEHSRQLESRCQAVSQENTSLESEVDHLRSEILSLKNELLRHSQCGDAGIKRHLAQMIKEISDRGAAGSGTDESSNNASDGGGGKMGSSRESGHGERKMEDDQDHDEDQDLKTEKMDFDFDDLVRLPPSNGGAAVEQRASVAE
ncbi:hypothetical protein BO70DRAFT_361472 [Aspergillus heteromorphus CBS 117.55]|uniref:Basic leucine zipper (bZIP) transcription factor atfB n=1 Tax=Aspergillus heteromorphus CBS 117.55 TaxID=1448321 RepID=A0A317WGN7_9EURO|nr:uncharacterized protein BO70DRAFT_361472 [Aspergillus heteromorphus CBS 117.55]PWY83360.1 hypothetical protein BO70DRAFT_361472 [Aspergillus heteromorphus CBS 117.55]